MDKSIMQMCADEIAERDKQITDLEAKLVEKEEQLKLAKMGESFEQEKKNNALKSQNQTAIVVLEEMLDNEVYINSKLDFEDGNYVLSKIIRLKIEELKNESI